MTDLHFYDDAPIIFIDKEVPMTDRQPQTVDEILSQLGEQYQSFPPFSERIGIKAEAKAELYALIKGAINFYIGVDDLHPDAQKTQERLLAAQRRCLNKLFNKEKPMALYDVQTCLTCGATLWIDGTCPECSKEQP